MSDTVGVGHADDPGRAGRPRSGLGSWAGRWLRPAPAGARDVERRRRPTPGSGPDARPSTRSPALTVSRLWRDDALGPAERRRLRPDRDRHRAGAAEAAHRHPAHRADAAGHRRRRRPRRSRQSRCTPSERRAQAASASLSWPSRASPPADGADVAVRLGVAGNDEERRLGHDQVVGPDQVAGPEDVVVEDQDRTVKLPVASVLTSWVPIPLDQVSTTTSLGAKLWPTAWSQNRAARPGRT